MTGTRQLDHVEAYLSMTASTQVSFDYGSEADAETIRDTERLVETMQWCLDHPDAMQEISRAAMERTARWQWSDYRAGLGAAVLSFLEQWAGSRHR